MDRQPAMLVARRMLLVAGWGMRRALAFVFLVPAIAMVSVAVAQPRRPKPKVDAGGGDNPYEDKAPTTSADAGAPATTATTTPASDAGAVGPMPRPDIGDGGAKLSPLNPQASEFPEAGAPPAAQTIDYDKLLADIAALRAR